ncbi:MAG: pilus assembly protein PilE [Legionellales bacterium]|nr:pilus assembly protein PilE [Legionellales bacterium]
MKARLSRGFTLIELAIVFIILAILASIAYPTYTSYIASSRRADGQVALLDLANRMDRFFTENNTYAGATLANLNIPAASPEGFYTLSITNATANAYNIQAAPTGAQAGQDPECATLTYNNLGQKGITGTGTAGGCW